MSDNATMILTEQVSDELLDMKLSDFFALLYEYDFNGNYERLSTLLDAVVDIIVEERSE